MGKWVLCTQPNYAHPKPTHLTPLAYKHVTTIKCWDTNVTLTYKKNLNNNRYWVATLTPSRALVLSIYTIKPKMLDIFLTLWEVATLALLPPQFYTSLLFIYLFLTLWEVTTAALPPLKFHITLLFFK